MPLQSASFWWQGGEQQAQGLKAQDNATETDWHLLP
jgi:hypothetical protein